MTLGRTPSRNQGLIGSKAPSLQLYVPLFSSVMLQDCYICHNKATIVSPCEEGNGLALHRSQAGAVESWKCSSWFIQFVDKYVGVAFLPERRNDRFQVLVTGTQVEVPLINDCSFSVICLGRSAISFHLRLATTCNIVIIGL